MHKRAQILADLAKASTLDEQRHLVAELENDDADDDWAGPDALRELTLRVEPGELVAVLGAVGERGLDVAGVRGERKIEYPTEERTSVHRRERESGIFRRTFAFPVPVDAEKAEAVYRDGILRVRLPKAASHRPRQIAVQTS